MNGHFLCIKHKLICFTFRFPTASDHTFLIDSIIKPLSQLYASRNDAFGFLQDVTSITAKNLLCGSSVDDKQVQDDFTKFLKKYCTQHKLSQKIPEIFQNSTLKVCSQLNSCMNSSYNNSTQIAEESYLTVYHCNPVYGIGWL